jgi:hypothetical protein
LITSKVKSEGVLKVSMKRPLSRSLLIFTLLLCATYVIYGVLNIVSMLEDTLIYDLNLGLFAIVYFISVIVLFHRGHNPSHFLIPLLILLYGAIDAAMSYFGYATVVPILPATNLDGYVVAPLFLVLAILCVLAWLDRIPTTRRFDPPFEGAVIIGLAALLWQISNLAVINSTQAPIGQFFAIPGGLLASACAPQYAAYGPLTSCQALAVIICNTLVYATVGYLLGNLRQRNKAK